jgi:hypothetical protein
MVTPWKLLERALNGVKLAIQESKKREYGTDGNNGTDGNF